MKRTCNNDDSSLIGSGDISNLPTDIWLWILFEEGDNDEHSRFYDFELHILRFVNKPIHSILHNLLGNGEFEFEWELNDTELYARDIDYIRPFAFSGNPSIIQWAMDFFTDSTCQPKNWLIGNEFFRILAQKGYLDCIRWLILTKNIVIRRFDDESIDFDIWYGALHSNKPYMLHGLKELAEAGKCPKPPAFAPHLIDVYMFGKVSAEMWIVYREFIESKKLSEE